MASHVKTKDNDQCRSHFIKILKTCGTLEGIILKYEKFQDFPGADSSDSSSPREKEDESPRLGSK